MLRGQRPEQGVGSSWRLAFWGGEQAQQTRKPAREPFYPQVRLAARELSHPIPVRSVYVLFEIEIGVRVVESHREKLTASPRYRR